MQAGTMTVEEMIAEADVKFPNDVDNAHKWGWITQLEHLIVDESFATHQINPMEQAMAQNVRCLNTLPRGYAPIAQPPYHDLYLHYIGMRIAELNVDTDEYNNQRELYNNALLTWKNKFNREHRAIDRGQRWRF